MSMVRTLEMLMSSEPGFQLGQGDTLCLAHVNGAKQCDSSRQRRSVLGSIS
jgi:hypothetical protein